MSEADEPTSLGSALDKLLNRWGVATSQAAGQLDRYAAVNETLAPFCQSAKVLKLEAALLAVQVDHPAEIEELLGQQEEILQAVNAALGLSDTSRVNRLHVSLRRT